MHITDHLHPASVALRQHADSMQAALQRLVDLMAANGNLTDPRPLRRTYRRGKRWAAPAWGRAWPFPTPKVRRYGSRVWQR